MSPNQIKAITRNPKVFMDFHLLGKVPRETKAPTTPLRDLILTIPIRLWPQFQGIQVNSKLGFSGERRFNTLHQLARWLGYNQTNMLNTRMPYQSWKIRGFQRKLFLDDLLKCTSKAPNNEILIRHIPKNLWRDPK